MSRIVLLVIILAAPLPANARSLAGNLHRFVANVATPIKAEVVDSITPVVERVAVRGIDFPVTSTAPSVTYTYDFELQTYQRASGSLGPIYGQRADTIGRRRLAVGFSYLYADLVNENGRDFGKRINLGTHVTADDTDVVGVFQGSHFSLASHVFSLSATYGVTNRWDVNVVLPVVDTILDLDGTVGARTQTGEQVFQNTDRVRFQDYFDNESTGLGDLLLRTKYRFRDDHEGPALASELALRLPTGDPENFHGLGDVIVSPTLVVSHGIGPHNVHGHLGVELNADDLQRTRARYGIGAVVQPLSRLAVVVDVLGSSSFTDDTFTIPTRGAIVPAFNLFPNDFVAGERSDAIVAFVPRSDVVDVSVGLKVRLFGSVVAFVNVIVPATRDSLRADVIPAAGLDATF